MKIIARLKQIYDNSIKIYLKKKFKCHNDMCIPKIKKIVVSLSTKSVIDSSISIDDLYNDLYLITGQKPLITKAKKSISAFKLRKGILLGVKTTLRKIIMYEFLDRLINIALPRVRDFRGINLYSFDKNGNISIGIREHVVFPEINYNKINQCKGLGITIITSAKTNIEARILLESFNMPFNSKE